MNQKALRAGPHPDFHCHARARHDGALVSEWLLARARKLGIGGGCGFRTTAGFGRHGTLREEPFFELADDLPVEIEFLLPVKQAELLLAEVRAAGSPWCTRARKHTSRNLADLD